MYKNSKREESGKSSMAIIRESKDVQSPGCRRNYWEPDSRRILDAENGT